LEPDLEKRLVSRAEIPFPPPGKLLESPRFLLGIAGSGEVQFVFLDKSSGDADADDAAERALRRSIFTGGTTGTAWGQATLIWRSAP